MALPIAPTPALTGKSAEALDRYMRESETQKDTLVMPRFDQKKLDSAYKRMMERRANGTKRKE